MRKLIVAFDEPSDGWLRIELGYEGHLLAEPFSHIYPTLPDLCSALCDLVAGRVARPVVFLVEPAQLEMSMRPSDSAMARTAET